MLNSNSRCCFTFVVFASICGCLLLSFHFRSHILSIHTFFAIQPSSHSEKDILQRLGRDHLALQQLSGVGFVGGSNLLRRHIFAGFNRLQTFLHRDSSIHQRGSSDSGVSLTISTGCAETAAARRTPTLYCSSPWFPLEKNTQTRGKQPCGL